MGSEKISRVKPPELAQQAALHRQREAGVQVEKSAQFSPDGVSLVMLP